jgi:PKD repeat protein
MKELTRCAIEEIVTITPGGTSDASFALAFDSSASLAPCGKIVKSIWSLGDGTKARGAKVTHNYAAPGDYTVKLELTDDRGNRNLVDIEYAVMVTAENVSTERRLHKKRKM